MDEGDCAYVQRRFIRLPHLGRPRAVGLQALRNHPQEDAQHHVQYSPVTLHEVAQPLRHRQHPLAHRQAGKNMIAEVCRRLHHAPGVARGADAAALAGIGHKVVVPAVIAPGPGKAMSEDAAFEVLLPPTENRQAGGAA